MEPLPHCDGDLKIGAAIIDALLIERIHSPSRIVTLALRAATFGPRACKFIGLLWVVYCRPGLSA